MKEAKSECNTLRRGFLALQEAQEHASPTRSEIDGMFERLTCSEKNLKRYKFKSRLFDSLCQEIKMMPYHIESAEVAIVYFDALRSWVRMKEKAVSREWGMCGSRPARTGLSRVALSSVGEEGGTDSLDSPSTSLEYSYSIDEGGYDGAGEEEEMVALDAF